MSLAVVTTFNADGYAKYGQRMLETFLQYWPRSVQMYLYVEGFTHHDPRIVQIDLHDANPELIAFKQRNRDRPVKNFHFDAIRFAHKVFAVSHAATTVRAQRLFWLDGDTVTFRAIPDRKLAEWLPDGYYTSCLLRKKLYTECSFVGYRLSDPVNEKFMQLWRDYYVTDRIYTLREYHDCESYDAVRRLLEKKKKLQTYNLSGKFDTVGHPFVNCELGAYMDHLKGTRKDESRSRDSDLKTTRTEEYWRQ